MSKTLISIIGPTGIGKTNISIELALRLNTKILSCDSRQFYKEMKIGNSAPTLEQLKKVKHYFIGHLSVTDNYTVGDFEKDALRLIEKLFEKNDKLIIVGGSGLYERAVTHGIDKIPDVEKNIKILIDEMYQKGGIELLRQELIKRDLDYYKEVDLNNPVRLIRALSICFQTGKPYSSFRKSNFAKRDFSVIKIGIEAPRELIYDRINQRVDKMFEEGLLDEAKLLYKYKNYNSLQTIGYKEIFSYLEGILSLDKAIEEIKKNSRRYAKRQLTWFKKDPNVRWFHYQDFDGILEAIEILIK